MITLSKPTVDRLRVALGCAKYTAGSTHGFYLYPARFSPEIARTVIETFSSPGDWVLDPFMGGGTAIVEGLALGRHMIGSDLNALAHFVTTVRTRPLSCRDRELIRAWAADVEVAGKNRPPRARPAPPIENLPGTVGAVIAVALTKVQSLPLPRQRAFARCALLRLGQWALDCRDHAAPPQARLAQKLPELAEEMFDGLEEFVGKCREAGFGRNAVVGHRLLMCRTAVGLQEEPRLRALGARPRLVFTSPPYSGVHVLYHRWQVRGRKETPAPYWIAQVPDGHYASHYAGGSRTPTGERNYFAMIRDAFSSVRQVLSDDALVVQLVGFADVERQLPQYLAMMTAAGLEAWTPTGADALRRVVPNRKWYAKLQGAVDASSEMLLFHRPKRLGTSV